MHNILVIGIPTHYWNSFYVV